MTIRFICNAGLNNKYIHPTFRCINFYSWRSWYNKMLCVCIFLSFNLTLLVMLVFIDLWGQRVSQGTEGDRNAWARTKRYNRMQGKEVVHGVLILVIACMEWYRRRRDYNTGMRNVHCRSVYYILDRPLVRDGPPNTTHDTRLTRFQRETHPPPVRTELTTPGLQDQRSTPELPRRWVPT